MVGGGYLRNVRSLYSRARSALAPSDVAEGSSRRGRGSSQGPSQDDTEEVAELPTQDEGSERDEEVQERDEEVQERDEDSQEEDEDLQHTASGSTGLWFRSLCCVESLLARSLESPSPTDTS
jgi:hypothetical protein